MNEVPETRHAISSDGTYIAYQIFGEGTTDILYVPGFASHLEVYWEHRLPARFFRRLGSLARVIMFDKRGTGLSDRVTTIPDLDTMMDDVRAVLEAAGSQRTVLWGDGPDGGGACAVYAATFPERAEALIWWEPMARSAWAPDYPWGESDEHFATEERLYREGWGTEQHTPEILRLLGASSIADDPEAVRWAAKWTRYAATPGAAITLARMWAAIDVRSVLPLVQVPTLLVSRDNRESPGEEAAFVASQIAGAQVAILSPCPDFPPWLGDLGETFEAIEAFIQSVHREERPSSIASSRP